MMTEIVNVISMIMVMLLASYVSVIDYLYFRKVKEPFRWVKFGYSLVSAFWVLLYGYFLLFRPIEFLPNPWTRLGVLGIFFLWAVGATVRAYGCGIFKPGRK